MFLAASNPPSLPPLLLAGVRVFSCVAISPDVSLLLSSGGVPSRLREAVASTGDPKVMVAALMKKKHEGSRVRAMSVTGRGCCGRAALSLPLGIHPG